MYLPKTPEEARRLRLPVYDPNAVWRDDLRQMAAEASRPLIVSNFGGLVTLSDGSVWLRTSEGRIELITAPYTVCAAAFRRGYTAKRHRAA